MERFRHLKEKLVGIAKGRYEKPRGITLVPPEELGQTAIEAARGAHDIKIAVTAKVGNPLFDALPQILESAPPDAKVQVILMTPENIKTDIKTQEAIKRIMEITEKKNKPGLGTFPSPEVGEEDLNQLSLELEGNPEFDNLTVFIQDPQDKSRYWFRKIGIVPGVTKIGDNEVPYVDLKRYPLEKFESVPCPEESLQTAVQNFSEWERELVQNNPELGSMQATVGIARYQGGKKLSLDTILNLVALKYNQIRQDYRTHQP